MTGAIIGIILGFVTLILSKLKSKKETSNCIEVSPIVSTLNDYTIKSMSVKVPTEDTAKVEVIETITIKKEKEAKELVITKKLLSSKQIMGKRNEDIKQIVLHHTASSTIDSCISWWMQTKERVGVGYIIGKDGKIVQVIDDENWAYSLGVDFSTNNISSKYKTRENAINIEKSAIGIELVCEGEVKSTGRGYLFEGGQRIIDASKVIRLNNGFRGYFDFVAYTPEQIESLRLLLVYLTEKYDIPKTYTSPFRINVEALKGKKGIYSHVCYRYPDKRDIFPQPELVNMLTNLINNK